ncbi:MAG: U32 family peptidase C-terminal domain-containing protein, partial [Clostridia bacterium]|nr:U32 family peptidase C-terminal domain-containing protein [Clostridia bacterium]
YDDELSKAENRPADDGFLSGECDSSKHLYGVNGAGVTHDYVAYVRGYDYVRNMAEIEVKNVFARGDEIEVFGPELDNKRFKVQLLFDDDYIMASLGVLSKRYRDAAFKLMQHSLSLA